MENDRITLQKEFEYYTNLLNQHERKTSKKQFSDNSFGITKNSSYSKYSHKSLPVSKDLGSSKVKWHGESSGTSFVRNHSSTKLYKKIGSPIKEISTNKTNGSSISTDLNKSKNSKDNKVCHDKKRTLNESKKSDSLKLMKDILAVTQQLKLKSENLDSTSKVNISFKTKVNFQEKHKFNNLTFNKNNSVSQNKYSFKMSSKDKSFHLNGKKTSAAMNSSFSKTKDLSSVMKLKTELRKYASPKTAPIKTTTHDSMKELNSLNKSLNHLPVDKDKASINDAPKPTSLQKEYLLREKLLKKQLENKYKSTQNSSNVIENKDILSKVHKFSNCDKAKPKCSNVMNSKYKIINKVETPINFRAKDATRSAKKIKRSLTPRKKIINSFKLINVNNKKYFILSPKISRNLKNRNKLNNPLYSKQNIKSKTTLFTPLNQSNVYISPTKYNFYKTNKSYSSINTLKNISSTRPELNSDVDVDLLLELAAERKSKLLKKNFRKQLYQNKNFINSYSQQTRTAKMIKSKYFSPNKRISNWKYAYRNYKGSHTSKRQLNRNKSMESHHSSTKMFSNKFYSEKCTPHKKRILHVGGEKYVVGLSGKSLKKISKKSLNSSKSSQQIILQRKSPLRSLYSIKSSTPVSKIIASRALNRSINQALTASAKKKLHKVKTYCMFYNRFGRCNKGVECPYVHDPNKIAICTRFLRGTCKNDKCLFSHEINPGKMAICSFFLKDECNNENCPYRHEKLSSNAELCKAFVQGYCSMGKDCKKAHILICPKYIQGLCDKGNDCVFPHPKDKDKKLVSKSENSAKKLDDNLLETVSRYFQSNPEENLDKASCVPQRKALGEQPSFISLSTDEMPT